MIKYFSAVKVKTAITTLMALLLAGYALAIFVPIPPDEARPGTRLTGDPLERQVEWPPIVGNKLVTVQTNTWYLIPHSVTVISWVADGNYYLGCGRCETKIWAAHVARNPEVIVKIGGELYEGRAILATGTERVVALSVPYGDEEIPDDAQAFKVDRR